MVYEPVGHCEVELVNTCDVKSPFVGVTPPKA
jgi:hypothetical protein